MYSKYKEIKVMEEILQNYANSINERYLYSTNSLQKIINKASKDIYEVPTPEKVGELIESMEYYADLYDKVTNFIRKLKLITLTYEISFTKENIKTTLPLKTEEKLIKDFYQLENNEEFKLIISEVAYDLWINADDLITNCNEEDYHDNLYKMYEEDEITQKELIFYNIMTKYLHNHPRYNNDMENNVKKLI